jgi:hypothetical protein
MFGGVKVRADVVRQEWIAMQWHRPLLPILHGLMKKIAAGVLRNRRIIHAFSNRKEGCRAR